MSYVHCVALVFATTIAATVFNKAQTEKVPDYLRRNICTWIILI